MKIISGVNICLKFKISFKAVGKKKLYDFKIFTNFNFTFKKLVIRKGKKVN